MKHSETNPGGINPDEIVASGSYHPQPDKNYKPGDYFDDGKGHHETLPSLGDSEAQEVAVQPKEGAFMHEAISGDDPHRITPVQPDSSEVEAIVWRLAKRIDPLVSWATHDHAWGMGSAKHEIESLLREARREEREDISAAYFRRLDKHGQEHANIFMGIMRSSNPSELTDTNSGGKS